MNIPKLRNNMLEIVKFILGELCLRFPKLSIYIQPLPESIKCQLNFMEYSPSEYTLRVIYF